MENILCDTTTSLTPALDVLRASNVLILDCEGDELGKQGGTLSMIVLRTTSSNPPPQTYLIDVTRLSSSDLRPVYDLLESEAATKVVFDGRMDYSALFHEKSVDTKKVLDMQLADVRSRIVRGEDQEGRLERLRGFIHWPDVKGQPDLYKRVQRLNSLRACMKEHGVEVEGSGDITVTHKDWMTRPLPERYIQYAASDALLIHALYDKFKRSGYIDSSLTYQSMRYITIWKSKQLRRGQDERLAHPLLPLGILEDPVLFYTITQPAETRMLGLLGYQEEDQNAR
ncbi:3 -5 exonuclease and kh-i domain-containing protein [Moniliophthora roreri MCA 2997]|uniref:3-5 exonuclease and kh-i domain-containing protein n=1 Tax=Moniliophthora roreri (strain MCA 2997) TaxID=1381753 RepID=V2WN28_MONRO|nr:3 -5 exonuclease and kh-i domain-containing protein [Moniliophthora roreri MCA 2997]